VDELRNYDTLIPSGRHLSMALQHSLKRLGLLARFLNLMPCDSDGGDDRKINKNKKRKLKEI